MYAALDNAPREFRIGLNVQGTLTYAAAYTRLDNDPSEHHSHTFKCAPIVASGGSILQSSRRPNLFPLRAIWQRAEVGACL
jgi:hypothetical protein